MTRISVTERMRKQPLSIQRQDQQCCTHKLKTRCFFQSCSQSCLVEEHSEGTLRSGSDRCVDVKISDQLRSEKYAGLKASVAVCK